LKAKQKTIYQAIIQKKGEYWVRKVANMLLVVRLKGAEPTHF